MSTLTEVSKRGWCISLINCSNIETQFLYMWASFILLGRLLPDKFDHRSFKFDTPECTLKDRVGSDLGFGSALNDERYFKKYLNAEQTQYYLTHTTDEAKRISETTKLEALVQQRALDEKAHEARKAREAAEIKKISDEKEAQKKLTDQKTERLSLTLHERVAGFDVDVRSIMDLIERGADIDYQSKTDGYSALMIAVDKDNQRIVEYLLKRGANIFLKNKRDEIARDLASTDSVITSILLGYEVIYAVQHDDLEILKMALRRNASIEFRWGIAGFTPLLLAIQESRNKMVRFLLAEGADSGAILIDGRGMLDLITNEETHTIITSMKHAHDEIKAAAVSSSFAQKTIKRHGGHGIFASSSEGAESSIPRPAPLKPGEVDYVDLSD